MSDGLQKYKISDFRFWGTNQTMRQAFLTRYLDHCAQQILVNKQRLHLPGLEMRYDRSHKQVFHAHPELFLTLRGMHYFQCGEQRLESAEEDLTLIPQGIPHKESITKTQGSFLSIVIMPKHDSLVTLFGISMEADGLMDCPYVDLYSSQHVPEIVKLCEWIALNQPSRDGIGIGLDSNYSRGLLVAVIERIAQSLQYPLQANGTQQQYSILVKQCHRMILYEFSHHTTTVANLAKRLRCNADYLSRVYKKETGKGITETIQSRRMDLACSLLQATRLNVSEIAWSCGYYSSAHFISTFKKAHGTTPRKYQSGANVITE